MLYGDGIHDDTLTIQSMLDERGIVAIDRPGTYLISRTLIIRSNTRFVLSPGAVLLCAPFSRCSLIENEHFAGGGRDFNIGIIGGEWDGNCDEQGLNGVYEAEHRLDPPYDSRRFTGKLIRFAHVENIALEKMTVRNQVSYGIQIADVRGFVVRDLRFEHNWHFGTADGVHINGPASDGVIENLYGTTNDDMVSLTSIDESHAEVSAGEISNIVISNVSAVNGYSGVRLLSGGGHAVRCIHVRGVYGDYRHNAVLISQHNLRPGMPVWFDDITVEHVHAHKTEKHLPDSCFRYWDENCVEKLSVVWVEKGVCIGSLNLRDIFRHETTHTEGYLVQLDEGAVIDRLVADNIWQTTAEGVNAPMWFNKADVRQLVERSAER